MPTFLCKLIPPRPDFTTTLSDEEKAIMGRHAAYLRGLLDKDKVLVFGLVADPAGPWGLALFTCADESEVNALTANDPAVLSGKGLRYDITPMHSAVVRNGPG